jgi:hypothetical protein
VELFVEVVEEVAEGRKVGVVGERVGVAVAKKEVVGEVFVDVVEVVVAEVVLVVVEVEWEELEEVPEEMIWWFVGHMKMGRPIVSFARVSILFAVLVYCVVLDSC